MQKKRETLRCLILWACIGLLSPRAHAAQVVSVVRGVGPGSEQAASLVGHYVHEAFVKDGRYETKDVTQQLGDAGRDRALKSFDEAEDMLNKGREAYERLDLDVAEQTVREVLSRYERQAAYVSEFNKVAEALMLLGATYILRGEEQNGIKRLEQAINVFAAIEPDPRLFNPAMRVQFSETQQKLRARSPGALSVSSSPDHAEVFVDGIFAGVTPVTVERLSEGDHYVRVERPGMRPFGRIASVRAHKETPVNANLRAAPHFDVYDNVLDAGSRAVVTDKKDDAHLFDAAVAPLKEVIEADLVFLAAVSLDGERVHITGNLFDLSNHKMMAADEHIFAYENRLDTYEREIGIMLHEGFGLDLGNGRSKKASSGQAQSAHPAEDEVLPHAGDAAMCAGGRINCRRLRIAVGTAQLGVGVASIIGGVAAWAVAGEKNSSWKKVTQTSIQQPGLYYDGHVAALAGDVLVGIGAVLAVTGTLTLVLWDPTPSIEDVTKRRDRDRDRDKVRARDPVTLDLRMAPMVHGGILTAQVNY